VGGAAAGVSAHSAPLFATLGHQESWGQIAAMLAAMRPPAQRPLTDTELREIVPWIPPRTVSRLEVAAAPDAAPVHGVYIETFITPTELALRPIRRVLVQMLGLGLAVAVLVDATVIRCLLGPALMRVAGRWNWWPLAK